MLNRDNLIEEAKTKLPLFSKEYDRQVKEDIIDFETGNHIVFSYVFTPILVEAIREKQTCDIVPLFSFLEEMASSDDDAVVEVCDQSVLEVLNDEFDDCDIIGYMKPNTKEGFVALKGYMR